MKTRVMSSQQEPWVLATYVIQAVCSEWPDAQASADAALRDYEERFGPWVRNSTLQVSTCFQGRAVSSRDVWEEAEAAAPESPIGGALAQGLRAPFVDRWVRGAAMADDVFNVGLVVDLLRPLTQTPAFVRAGGWVLVKSRLCQAIEAKTGVAASVWKGVIDAKRDAMAALHQHDGSFYGRYERTLLRGARAWVLKRVPNPGGDVMTLEQLVAELRVDSAPDVSRLIKPFDAAMEVQRQVGAPLGQSHHFR